MNVKGRVKLITEKEYNILDTTITGSKEFERDSNTYTFNEKGDLTEKVIYDVSDSLWKSNEYSYDDNGRLVQWYQYYPVYYMGEYPHVFDKNGKMVVSKDLDIWADNNLQVQEFTQYDTGGNIIGQDSYSKEDSLYIEKSFRYNDKGKMIEMTEISSDTDYEWTTYKYDSKGNMIETEHGNMDSTYNKDIYKYNDNGKLIEIDKVDPDGSSHYSFIYKYDSAGDTIEQDDYFPYQRELYNKSTYSYDSKGNKTEEDSYNSEGHLVQKNIYKYDSTNNKTEWDFYIGNRWFADFTIRYDKKGNITDEASFNLNGDLTNRYNYWYDYDKTGNWIKKIGFKDGIPQFIIEREIDYY